MLHLAKNKAKIYVFAVLLKEQEKRKVYIVYSYLISGLC